MGRIVLPVISRLDFRGPSGFLNDLVDGIDAPRLGNIEVTYFDGPWHQTHRSPWTFDNFIKRIKMHDSHRQADILSSDGAISVSLVQPGASTCLKLQLLCKPSSEQITFVTRICRYFSAFKTEDLRINSTRPLEGESRRSWIGFMGLFKSVKWFHIAGYMMGLVQDLLIPDERSDASSYGLKEGFHQSRLPVLHKLYLQQLGPRHRPLSVPIVLFMIARWRSGRPIAVEYERPCDMSESLGAGTRYAQCHHRYSLTRVE